MKSKLLYFICIAVLVILQSCYDCYRPSYYRLRYKLAYNKNFPSKKNKKKYNYYKNFDLFSMSGDSVISKAQGYLYTQTWQDSFYLYYYSLDDYKSCLFHNFPTLKYKDERPVWKFYPINDTTYISHMLIVGRKGFQGGIGGYGYFSRQTFIHTPSYIWYGRQYYLDTFPPKVILGLEKTKSSEMLFWEFAKQSRYMFQNNSFVEQTPTFSMDSLIRSFQK